MPREPLGKPEAIAVGVAGAAFAGSLLFLRQATLLPAGFFDAAAALAAAWGLAPLLHRKAGASSATLLRGSGAAVAVLLSFPTFGPTLSEVAMAAALAVGGITFLQAAMHATRGGWWLKIVGTMLSLAGIVTGHAAAVFFEETLRLRSTIYFVAGILVLGLALRAWLQKKNQAAFAPTPVGLFIGGTLTGLYLFYRPLVATGVHNLPLYEWALAVGAATLLFARLQRAASGEGTPEAWSSGASRHAQDVRPLYDERMAPLAAVFTRFIERGEGHEAYRGLVENHMETPLPKHIQESLEAARKATRTNLRPGMRREAREARLAIHRALVAHIAQIRGKPHGTHERTLRPDP